MEESIRTPAEYVLVYAKFLNGNETRMESSRSAGGMLRKVYLSKR